MDDSMKDMAWHDSSAWPFDNPYCFAGHAEGSSYDSIWLAGTHARIFPAKPF